MANPYYSFDGDTYGGYASPYATRPPAASTNPYAATTTPSREQPQPVNWASTNAYQTPQSTAAPPNTSWTSRLVGFDRAKLTGAANSPKYSFGRWFGQHVADPRQWAQSWSQFQATDPRWQGWTPQGDRLVYTGQGTPDRYFGDLRDIDVVRNYTGQGAAQYAWLKRNGRGAAPTPAAPPLPVWTAFPAQAMPQQGPSQDFTAMAQMIGQLQAQFAAYQAQQQAAAQEQARQQYLADREASNPRVSYY
jgi:hypothetical protein